MFIITIAEEIGTPICKRCFSTKVRPLNSFEGIAFSGVVLYESTGTETNQVSDRQVQRFVCEECGTQMEFTKEKDLKNA